MNRTTTLSLLGGAALAVAAPAAAQDTGRSWTGPYVGGQVGYAFQPNDNDEVISFDTDRDGSFGNTIPRVAAGAVVPASNAFSTGFCGGYALASTAASGCGDDTDAVNWRVHAGYDYQLGTSPFVLGAVVEFGRTHTVMDQVTAFSTTPAFYTMTREYRYGGNLRARAGYALGDTLVYATGGGSIASIYYRNATSNAVNTFNYNGTDGPTDRKKAYGYNAGGGIEQRIGDKLSIGILYLFTALEDKNRVLTVAGRNSMMALNPFVAGNAAGTDFKRTGKWFYQNSVNVTASYRF